MDDTTRKSVTQRLSSAAGHIKGIERMVNDDVYCIDTFRQIQAVQAALNKISVLLLDTHLHTCLAVAVHGDDAAERERMLQEVVDIFEVSQNPQ